MIHVGICDDDHGIRRIIELFVADYAMKHSLLVEIKTYGNGAALVESNEPFDIIFLDIKMPVMNGIDAGKILRKRDKHVQIIYITAYEQYAVEAFQVRALDYLVKPFEIQRIYEVLDEALSAIDLEGSQIVMKFKYLSFLAHQVRCVEGNKNHQVIIHTIEDVYTVNGALKEFEPLLIERQFIKIKRGVWINSLYKEEKI